MGHVFCILNLGKLSSKTKLSTKRISTDHKNQTGKKSRFYVEVYDITSLKS